MMMFLVFKNLRHVITTKIGSKVDCMGFIYYFYCYTSQFLVQLTFYNFDIDTGFFGFYQYSKSVLILVSTLASMCNCVLYWWYVDIPTLKNQIKIASNFAYIYILLFKNRCIHQYFWIEKNK